MQEMDQDPKYEKLSDPHIKFLAQLKDWEERRKRARMRKSGFKFPEEMPGHVPPKQLENPAKNYNGELARYIEPNNVELKGSLTRLKITHLC